MIAWSYYCRKLDGKHKNTLLLIVNEKKKDCTAVEGKNTKGMAQ